ncbi:MAG: ribonuclease J [Myxococcota bacterium]
MQPESLDPAALHFLPLGGTGEIGMNLNLYHTSGRWLMVDCGVMFGRDGPHDMHAVYPDPSFIVARRHQLEGLILTHAHQDHIGAVVDLWPVLRCRVFATRFCAAMLQSALAEANLTDEVPIRLLDERAKIKLGPFELQRVPLTHSTVEMGALIIRTSRGAVLHTGDWKLDPDPVEGRTSDQRALQRLADEQVVACVSDSTNADQEGWTPSEGSLKAPIQRLLAGCEHRVAFTLFASNVARIRTIVKAALEADRHPMLLGRSLQRTVQAAQRAGYLTDLPPFVSLREFGFIPRDRVLLLCTGSQGEPRAGLSRLAADQHRDAYFEPDDTVVFSARAIPGNELFIARIEKLLNERGVNIVRSDTAAVHVSGHPRRDELRALYEWVQPKFIVPVHGTPSKLEAHAALAEDQGFGAVRMRNGDVLRLAPGPVEVIQRVRTGRIKRVEEDRTARRGRDPRRGDRRKRRPTNRRR